MENIRIKDIIEEEENKKNNVLTFNSDSKVVEIDGREIGFFNVFFIDGRLTLEYNLFSKYRNKGIGADFVKIVTHIVEEQYPDYSEIHLLISPNNIASIKVARANGYGSCSDYEFLELISSEGGFYLFSKANSLYNGKRKV